MKYKKQKDQSLFSQKVAQVVSVVYLPFVHAVEIWHTFLTH